MRELEWIEEKIKSAKDCGITNLRDLGGYETSDGRIVKHDVLYRGAGTYQQTESQKQCFENLGIKILFDLRSSFEVEREPDYIPEGTKYLNHSGITTMEQSAIPGIDIDLEGNLDMKSVIFYFLRHPRKISVLKNYLSDSYQTMVIDPSAFRALFQTLLENPGDKILFHCSAGKDRTGVSAAFILHVLGVPMETIMEDYLLSNAFRAEENEVYLAKLRESVHNAKLMEIFTDMLEVKQKYLQLVFQTIDEKYGNFQNFAYEGLALSEEKIAFLQSTLLE